VAEAATLLLGLQDPPLLRFVAAIGVLAIVAAGVQQLRRQRDGPLAVLACIVLVGPALLLLASHGRIVQVRYFLASLPLFPAAFLEAAGPGLGALRPRRGAQCSSWWFATYLAGNLQRDVFPSEGRARRISKAIAYMLQRTPQGPVLVASDHDFRNGMVLDFHAARLPGGSACTTSRRRSRRR
jgi:hypothetical protein